MFDHLQSERNKTMAARVSQPRIEYVAVPGYFLQDETKTDASSFDCWTAPNFGLVPRPYDSDATIDPDHTRTTQWVRFAHHIRTLNRLELEREKQAAGATGNDTVLPNVPVKYRYKVLFLGRHGEGYHNAAEAKYGKEAWDNYWSLLPGDSTSYWVDSELSPKGIQQALAANKAWAQQFHQGLPVPQIFYTSPHVRCLRTAHFTFSGLQIPLSTTDPEALATLSATERQTNWGTLKLELKVKELLREVISPHTCDQRSSKTHILSLFSSPSISSSSSPPTVTDSSSEPPPIVTIDDATFAEHDPYWSPSFHETNDMVQTRLRVAFDEIFERERPPYPASVPASTSSYSSPSPASFNPDKIGDKLGPDHFNEMAQSELGLGRDFISLTMHSGAIRNTLALLGHRPFHLWSCGMIPAVVRVGYHY
ncbi:hypothetical protein L228DRAFT_257808 [Xylona heveae TC161]|uniref:Phosphoglycerate mutase-like protein n=1 Tax=Xylona heveae (strain CBS 132557 / TC161) TaxID=1328760 RepID=A0A165JKM5_XYLHT|nr:hypothetical protein L228DRAFT_257808 [Xylona heveae TC161]KZF26354.1 hypothetical protein L228DRAFT_257808 [Xylona heveae TC161]